LLFASFRASPSRIFRSATKRIAAAIRYREPIIGDTDAYRVIFTKSDFLPGLIVDRYNDVLSVQILTQAMDATQIRETIISDLADRYGQLLSFERVDPRMTGARTAAAA